MQSFFFSSGTRTNQNKTAYICSTLILLSETFSLVWKFEINEKLGMNTSLSDRRTLCVKATNVCNLEWMMHWMTTVALKFLFSAKRLSKLEHFFLKLFFMFCLIWFSHAMMTAVMLTVVGLSQDSFDSGKCACGLLQEVANSNLTLFSVFIGLTKTLS